MIGNCLRSIILKPTLERIFSPLVFDAEHRVSIQLGISAGFMETN